MRQSLLFLFVIAALAFSSCNKRNDLEPEIKFKTTEGTIVVRLYAETPKHRDNFVKLVESGYYNGMLFHRVIRDFMIQSGDPESKKAKKKQFLGSGDVKYSIPAEIVYPRYYHKKGALAAARQGDDTNPERASSGGQFYFVKGHKFTDKQLDSLESVRKIKVENPPLDAISDLEADPYYSRIVKLFIPLQYATNIYGTYLASRKGTSLADQALLGTSVVS